MKYLLTFLLISLFTTPSFGQNRNRPTVIITPNGPVRLHTPFDKPQSDLKGVGNEFVGRAKVKEGKVSVFIRGCQNVELGDINNPDLEKDDLEKLKKIKNNDVIKLKMSQYGSCEVAGWKKN